MPSPPPLARAFSSKGARALAIVVAVIAVAVAISRIDLTPNLHHVRVAMLSGPAEGNYHAIVDRLRASAAKKGAGVENVTSEGSLDNLQKLAASSRSRSCEVAFALVQSGLPWPDDAGLELVGELPRGESVFLLGKNADRITDFASLAHFRVGIGPEGSGTTRLAREIFGSRDFAGLDLKLSNHSIAEQLDLAQRGDIDLAVFVMDEDASFIEAAVRDRGLQIAGFSNLDVVARRSPFLRKGRIGAGQYDPVRMLPPADKAVLRVNTLVARNRCARRSHTIGLLSLLALELPDFIRHNREARGAPGLELASVARDYFERGSPEILDEYFPRVGDVMPPSNWVHLVMGLSVLFNLMGIANRFVLWRIDAARVGAEQEIAAAFGPTITLGDIARLDPVGAHLHPSIGDEVDRVIRELEVLAARSRKLSLSVLVPMGSEMAYRYQEQLIYETLAVLRGLQDRRRSASERAAA